MKKMKLTMYRKMMIGFLVIIVVMSAVNGYILYELHAVSKTTKLTLTSDVLTIDLSKQLQTVLHDEEVYARKYLISHDNVYYALFSERSRRFTEFINYLFSAELDSTERNYARRIERGHSEFAQAFEEESQNLFVSRPEISPNDILPFDSLDVIYATLDRLIRVNQMSIESSMATVGSTTGRSSNIAFLLTICVVLTAITLAFLITRTVTRPIEILRHGTEQVAKGSFETIRVTSNDEFALLTEAFNDMSAKLKSVNERKAEMMQRISHELRTPLQALLSAHFLLTEQRLGPINAQQARVLQSIRESIDKLTNFSNQFLDISKIEAGMMEYSFERVDPVQLVRPLVDDARLIAVRKDIRVELVHTDVPQVVADPEKISQVVSNLLSNAIKYTPRSGTITVTVGPSASGVRIAVQDSVVGIGPEDVPRIFEKFYQARNAGKSSVKGTGVGLALVKALTEGHGGTVSVTSTVGSGSTFVVDLPTGTGKQGRKRVLKPVREAGVLHA
jgi:two-component system sensor histidine kinase GlrK